MCCTAASVTNDFELFFRKLVMFHISPISDLGLIPHQEFQFHPLFYLIVASPTLQHFWYFPCNFTPTFGDFWGYLVYFKCHGKCGFVQGFAVYESCLLEKTSALTNTSRKLSISVCNLSVWRSWVKEILALQHPISCIIVYWLFRIWYQPSVNSFFHILESPRDCTKY